jgi:hypothetical protein
MKKGFHIESNQDRHDTGFTLTLGLVYLDEKEKLSNVTDSFDSPHRDWNALEIWVHGGKHFERPEVAAPWVMLRFNHSCADVKQVEAAAKAMRKIERGVEKIREKEGPEGDWVGAVVRFARVMGLEFVARQVSGHGHFYADNGYKIETIGAATFTLREMLKDYCKANDVTVAA